jgi:hypothetical protein
MIGVVVDNIFNCPQQYLLFRTLNELVKTHDCYVFTNTIQSLPIQNKFCILQHVEAMSHKGTLIATSILNAQIVANSLTPQKKLFYVWYPEWATLQNFGNHQLTKILYNDDMQLVARSHSHHHLLQKLFKTPVGVVCNWNLDQLREVI